MFEGTILSFIIDLIITIIDVGQSIFENRKLQANQKCNGSDDSIKKSITTATFKRLSPYGCFTYVLSLIWSLIFFVVLLLSFSTFVAFTAYVIYGNKDTCFLGCCNLICNIGCNFIGNIFCY